jgi:hypothetical protein
MFARGTKRRGVFKTLGILLLGLVVIGASARPAEAGWRHHRHHRGWHRRPYQARYYAPRAYSYGRGYNGVPFYGYGVGSY